MLFRSTIWFGADGGYSFISALAEDNKLAVKSLALLEKKLKKRGLHPLFITGHTGWTDNMEFAFAHKNELCSPFKKRTHDPNAPISCPMVIFFRSMETTRSASRCPAESAKAKRTFFSGSAAASVRACTLLPTNTMFFVRFARSVSRTESSCV